MTTSAKQFVLLLTATVDPGATPMVARKDPRTRLRDYEIALTTWLESDIIHRVVVYENSGYDISSLRSIADRFPRHEVEFHSFEANTGGALRGKGYSELAGIARTLRQSKLLRDEDLLVKCTGRLVVRNARQLIKSIGNERFDIMCTLHGYLTYAESRLFIATPNFISNYLIPRQETIDDFKNSVFENALAAATAHAIADGKAWRPFPVFPVIDGVSGTTGEVLTNRIGKRFFRTISHRVRRFVFQH